MNAESSRLRECGQGVAWRKWGPYLSERQWGTVREDYSDNGDAWSYFSHDQARSRAYRWGEDGIAGISDDQQQLCFAIALWNGADPIIKERMFGLTNHEGNHGEDVKEYYFYLDNTPTHSYMRHLYKYPQAAFPYDDLVATNRRRGRCEPEYELLDTGVFEGDRYVDVYTEYAKEDADDIAVVITLINRGSKPCELHVLPTLWFRNTWDADPSAVRPQIEVAVETTEHAVVQAWHPILGSMYLHCEAPRALLFTENESNTERLFGRSNATPWVKDGINDYLVFGRGEAVNPARRGTKMAVHYRLSLDPNVPRRLRLRLSSARAPMPAEWLAGVESIAAHRTEEATAFYADLVPGCNEDEMRVLRQAFAGMLWTKQYYHYDVQRWVQERSLQQVSPVPRNRQWIHLCNRHVISMPDKWEYPWYAAWDLAFHTLALGMVDRQFAEEQLELMLRSAYLHPNGQIPAYEWNFSDVNPPVHAWALLFMQTIGKRTGEPLSADYLRRTFYPLMLNFNWWVNRKDRAGKNVFDGGFLGLDNIGVFDRSSSLPGGGTLEQADGNAWMAFFSQTMMALALELSTHDPLYQDMAAKYLEHFLWIGSAMDQDGQVDHEMWDEADGFFYDVLLLPNGSATRVKIRSQVGLLPLCATLTVEQHVLERSPRFMALAREFIARHPQATVNLANVQRPGKHGRRLLAVVDETKLRRLLARMLDEQQFLSPHGIRSLSKEHLEHPYSLQVDGQTFTIQYLPAESDSGMFGGNSNWRGPVWFPLNVLIIRALLEYYRYFGDEFTVECPTGSGRKMTLFDIAMDLCQRLNGIFLQNEQGQRPVHGAEHKFQADPHWRDHLLFYEYFHGDHGGGLGASHQTGWTGLVVRTIQFTKILSAQSFLDTIR